MTSIQKVEFTEEQREYVRSIYTLNRMSRVAMIIYLVKMKSARVETDDEFEAEDITELIDNTIRSLSMMTDEEYQDIIQQ